MTYGTRSLAAWPPGQARHTTRTAFHPGTGTADRETAPLAGHSAPLLRTARRAGVAARPDTGNGPGIRAIRTPLTRS